MAMTDREQQIATLYDAGLSSREIAKELSLSRRYVSLVVFRLGLSDVGQNPHEQSIRMGTAALLSALRREGFA